MKSSKTHINSTKFYKEQLANFYLYLNKSQKFEEEDIHQLRVSIKYMRSILLLINSESSSDIKQISKQLDQVFKPAGRLRNVHINRNLINELNIRFPILYAKYLNRMERKYENAFSRTIQKFELKKFKKYSRSLLRRMNGLDTKYLNKSINKTIRDHEDKLLFLLAKSNSREYLHDVRKHMKVIKTMLKVKLQLSSTKRAKSKLKHLNKQEETIGKWHDSYMLLQDLKRFIRKNKNDILPAVSAYSKLRKLNVELERRIWRSLRAFYLD